MPPVGIPDALIPALRIRSLGYLMPEFAASVRRVVERMEGRGHDPVVIETLRIAALQVEYHRRGTSKQKDVLRSMHGHGLAVDIISQSRGWDYSQAWKDDLVAACKAEGVTCGGLWKNPVDWPHVQHGAIPGAVPDALVAAFNTGGLTASWEYVRKVAAGRRA